MAESVDVLFKIILLELLEKGILSGTYKKVQTTAILESDLPDHKLQVHHKLFSCCFNQALIKIQIYSFHIQRTFNNHNTYLTSIQKGKWYKEGEI